MPECWLYTIQGKKQLFEVRLSSQPGPAFHSFQEQLFHGQLFIKCSTGNQLSKLKNDECMVLANVILSITRVHKCNKNLFLIFYRHC